MQRIVVNRGATLAKDFAFTPTGTPTVAVTRSDGTTVTTGSVTATADPTVFEYTIPASSNTVLDTYTETWTAVSGGENQLFVDTIEVAGGHLFLIAQAQALQGLTSQTAENIAATRTLVETALERECARAFVPRYTLETLDGTGTRELLLSNPDLRVIRSVAVDDVAYSSSQLADLAMRPSGVLYNPSRWPLGRGNVIVGYEHGMGFVPPEISRAALILTKSWLGGQNRPIDDRAITFNATEGGTYSLAVPGRNGSAFGHPDVDAAVQRYSLTTLVA